MAIVLKCRYITGEGERLSSLLLCSCTVENSDITAVQYAFTALLIWMLRANLIELCGSRGCEMADNDRWRSCRDFVRPSIQRPHVAAEGGWSSPFVESLGGSCRSACMSGSDDALMDRNDANQ